jgi:hypothetical protein
MSAHVDEILFHNSVQIINNDRINYGILLMISSLSYKDHSLTTIWDPGANMSLITHKAARKLGLYGQEITLSVISHLHVQYANFYDAFVHIFDIHYLIYHKPYDCCIVLINVLSLNN